MPSFLDRELELAELAQLWSAPGPQMYVLYGRRRVGKTALLRRFLADRRAVLFQAAEVTPVDNLRALMARAADDLGRPSLAGAAPRDIEAALRLVCDAARTAAGPPTPPYGVVLDELPNLSAADPSVPSLVQRFVDSLPPDEPVRLFLCGSAMRTMEAEVLGQRSPLFGRRTGQRRLLPLPFEAWRGFCPELPVRDRLWLHAATGGVPAYLVPVEGCRTARDALLRLFFGRSALLAPEADFLLRTELSVVHTYASLLRAVAAGATRLAEAAERAGVDGKTASRYLATLAELGYVVRETSLDEPAPEKSRKGRYRVADALLRFHFRFVQPHRDVIERGDGEELFDRIVAPALPTFCGPVFEEVIRDAVAHDARSLFGSGAGRVGRLYGPWGELDLAMELLDGTFVAGECKTSPTPIGTEALAALRAKVGQVPTLAGRTPRLVLASLQGFTPALRRQAAAAGVHLVQPG